MDGFSIREATPEDKQAVLDCHNNVYDGLDYLPEFYDYFMAAQHIKAFVLLHGEKIIGFNAGMIIDDNKTMVSRAARINPQYEGKGLYKMLDDNLALWAKSRHVTVKAQTTTEHNKAITRPSFQEKNQRVVSRSMLRYTFEKSAVHQLSSFDEETQAVTAVDDYLLTEYITSHSAYLFPEGRVIVDFEPYKLLASNVPFVSQPAGVTEAFTDVHTHSGKHKGLLSFSTSIRVPAFSTRLTIDVYGNDNDSFERHAQKHLSRLKQKTEDKAVVTLFVDETFPGKMVDEVLQRYGATKDHSSPRHQLLFEMQL